MNKNNYYHHSEVTLHKALSCIPGLILALKLTLTSQGCGLHFAKKEMEVRVGQRLACVTLNMSSRARTGTCCSNNIVDSSFDHPWD